MDMATKRQTARSQNNREFIDRLVARRQRRGLPPDDRIEQALRPAREAAGLALDAAAGPAPVERLLETIVSEERPVLFVQSPWLNVTDVSIIGPEAQQLVDDLKARRADFELLLPLVGRIDVTHFAGGDYVGTGWLVAPDVVVTNRHVASLIAQWDGRKYVFNAGVGGAPIEAALCTAHETDDPPPDPSQVFAIDAVLYIERTAGPDIAFLHVVRPVSAARPNYIEVATTDVAADTEVFVVGYPARASRRVIPDQAAMSRLYRDRYDVKRAAPGYTMPTAEGSTRHDCTTLGGNSGSVVFDLKTARAVGLHFAGLYQESNFAVRASVLSDYVNRKRWQLPVVETGPAQPVASAAAAGSSAAAPGQQISSADCGCETTFTLPLSVTVRLGAPTVVTAASPSVAPATLTQLAPVSLAAAESAARDFWDQRPQGVVAVRVGFNAEGDEFGTVPLISASVLPSQLATVRSHGPARFQNLAVQYFPAEVGEQLESSPSLESVDSIAYDDDARVGPEFSFDPVDESMRVIAHVGPEYSWDQLEKFLDGARRQLVSAMYEFHGKLIADALQRRLDKNVKLELVVDNATFVKIRDPQLEFDRQTRFAHWAATHSDAFKRVVAPEGLQGLISDSYHMKVTVRDGDHFWLSSGNWKMTSSQPLITQQQRDHAAEVDLPGNREWHVVVHNETLAERFRAHIRQDFERSTELGGRELPARLLDETFVEVPAEEAVLQEERPPPSRILEPKKFEERIKVRPLLTPDREGEVYSKALLSLIRSARHSLLFQIPYISMRRNPREDRGFIDELIAALTLKLKTLEDARVLLRTKSSKFSSPTHVAWYFQSKGVDVSARLRQIDDHHTKGMIVDGKRVLIGSHNWSKPGVTLNRDASLLFDHEGIAGYYAQAFEIDWDRARPIRPRKFVETEAVGLQAGGVLRSMAYRRMPLSELVSDADD